MQRALLFLVLFSVCMLVKPHLMNYKPQTPSPIINPFSDFGYVISQQIKKFDIVMTKVFKTFILADSIDKEKIQDLLTFVSKKLDYELKPEHHIGEMLINITKSNIDNINNHHEETDPNSNSFERSNIRNLEQKSCRRGQLTTVNYTQYRCADGRRYHRKTLDSHCRMENLTYNTCICPSDFWGGACEKFVGLKCKIKLDNSLISCNGNPKGKFSSCNNVRRNDNITLKGTISCENKETEFLYEGVKNGRSFQKRQNSSPLFNYRIKTQKLILSEDIGLKLQAQAINWVNISSPYERSFPFSLTGEETHFSIDVNVDDNLITTSGSGRIFLQLNIKSDSFSIENAHSQLVYLDLLEDKQLEGTGASKQPHKNSPLIISMGMSGALVVILLILFLYFSKWKKQMNTLMEAKDLETKSDGSICDVSTRCDSDE